MKTTDELKEELKKKQIAAHKMWLENPTTQLLIDILKKRHDFYKTALIEGIMVESDKETETKLRSCISTSLTHLKLVTDSDTFVEQSQLKQQQTTQ